LNREPGRNPTIQEVARLAGVSQSTVSRVINGSPRVSPAARAAVDKVIAEVEYVPNNSARNLAQRRSDSIAVVIPDPENRLFDDPFFPSLLSGIGSGLVEHDLQLVLIRPQSPHDNDRAQAYLRGGHVEGAIFVGLASDDDRTKSLYARGVPLVIVGSSPDPAISNVDCDNREGSRLATAHLIGLGRRRIATIAGALESLSARERLEGYRSALSDAGIALDPGLEVLGGYTADGAIKGAADLLQRVPDIDGLTAANDVMAASALRVILDSGRRVPEDVAVVGFDDSPVARMTRPALSTVVQPVEAMGREAAHILAALVADGASPPRHVVFATTLVIRESSAAPSVATT
jgi:DNA-binding LacI/PurR family transcriptional regulator